MYGCLNEVGATPTGVFPNCPHGDFITHSKAGGLPRLEVLDVPRHGILTHTALHPHLAQLVAGLVDGHARLVVVHTAQDQADGLGTREVSSATQNISAVRCEREPGVGTMSVCVGVCVLVCVCVGGGSL